jgi:hypothetical protein
MALCERMIETAEQLRPPELPTDVHGWLRDSRLETSVQANDAVLAYLQTSRWPAPMSADLQTMLFLRVWFASEVLRGWHGRGKPRLPGSTDEAHLRELLIGDWFEQCLRWSAVRFLTGPQVPWSDN